MKTTGQASPPPLVSIVIATYNAERFLADTLDSVLDQTYRPIELIVVDDGSNDKSRRIAGDYAERHPFVRTFSHEGNANLGISASRNLGLSECEGEYVTFLDADDIWLPEKLDFEVTRLQAHPRVAMVCGATELWYSWCSNSEELGRVAEYRNRAPGTLRDEVRGIGGGTLDGVIEPPRLLVRHLGWKDGLPRIMSTLIRVEAARDVGGFEDCFRTLYEDQVFFSKMAVRYPALITNACHSRYRQHLASVCYQARSAPTSPALPNLPGSAQTQFYIWLEGYLLKNEPENHELRDLLQEQLEIAMKREGIVRENFLPQTP